MQDHSSGSQHKSRIAIHKKTGFERTVIQKELKAGSSEREAYKQRMLELIAKFDHPSIVRYIEVFEDEANIYTVCECLKGENVIENLWKQGSMSEGMTAKTILQILEAIVYIHNKGVALNKLNHQSILHILPGVQTPIKLIDFDSMGVEKGTHDIERVLGENKREAACYLSPEVINAKWSIKVDEWAIGVIMYYMLTGNPPFFNENYKETLKQISNYKFDTQSQRW